MSFTHLHVHSNFSFLDGGSSVRALIDRATVINGIAEYFAEGAPGELKAILDSWNLLEIAVKEGSAADRFPPARPVAVELSRG